MQSQPLPILAAGERYAGFVLDANGNIKHHLVLLPDRPSGRLEWQAAKAWAASVGGQLPDRQEHRLLCANCAPQDLIHNWHWLSEACADNRHLAWFGNFDRGTQSFFRKTDNGAAVAVRRWAPVLEGGAA